MTTAAVLIGRFQPFHSGHLALLKHALQVAPHVVVVLGSAFQPRSPKNPFTWAERAQTMLAPLPEADRRRVRFVPVRDYYDNARWVNAVQRGVAAELGDAGGPGQDVALVGHFKDASSEYLDDFPHWRLVSLPRQGRMDATTVRQAWFGATPATVNTALATVADELPPSTLDELANFAHTPAFLALQQEWQMLAKYQAAWAAAPYPPVFVTVDALIRWGAEVLLIERGHAPGKGLLALPGGFVEPRDTLWQSCLRELVEETQLQLPEHTLRRALQSVAVFDHPDRSQRGRTITHVHAFDLSSLPRPHVQAGDDAARTQWVAIRELAGLEDRFFEDHFHILDPFLRLTD